MFRLGPLVVAGLGNGRCRKLSEAWAADGSADRNCAAVEEVEGRREGSLRSVPHCGQGQLMSECDNVLSNVLSISTPRDFSTQLS